MNKVRNKIHELHTLTQSICFKNHSRIPTRVTICLLNFILRSWWIRNDVPFVPSISFNWILSRYVTFWFSHWSRRQQNSSRIPIPVPLKEAVCFLNCTFCVSPCCTAIWDQNLLKYLLIYVPKRVIRENIWPMCWKPPILCMSYEYLQGSRGCS